MAELRRRRKFRHRTNPFIETKSGVDGEASADEDDFDAYPTIGGFFVPDDEFE